MQIILTDYDVTQDEVDAFVNTLDLDSLKDNVTIIEGDTQNEVYINGEFAYFDTTKEDVASIIDSRLYASIYALCCEHFSDRYIEPSEPTEPSEPSEPVVTLEDIKQDTTTIQDTTAMTSEDALTLMEMLLTVDEKLNQLL